MRRALIDRRTTETQIALSLALEGKGKYMRHVKLKPGVATDSAALRRLIDDAYADIIARLAAR